MGAPVAAATALANTRTGRRVLIGALLIVGLVTAFLLTPLVAIPFAIAGQSVSAVDANRALPKASGAWGYPLAGSYSKGRGFGYNPVVGCSYCDIVADNVGASLKFTGVTVEHAPKASGPAADVSATGPVAAPVSYTGAGVAR